MNDSSSPQRRERIGLGGVLLLLGFLQHGALFRQLPVAVGHTLFQEAADVETVIVCDRQTDINNQRQKQGPKG